MSTSTAVTAAEALWEAAQHYPDRPCLTDLDAVSGPTTVTYRELVERVAATAGGFRSLGLEPGDRIALLLHNSQAYVQSYLGAVAAGLIVVPLNVRLLAEDYEHMLRDSGSRALVTTAEFLPRVPDLLNLTIIRADSEGTGSSHLDELAKQATPITSPMERDTSSPASLMYTSGTTGAPKAVVLSDRAWASVADTAMKTLDMGENEVTLHIAPLTHGAGFLLLPTIMLGGENLVCASFDAERTLDLLSSHGVTGMFVVPSMIRMMLDARPVGWVMPDSLRRIYYAGSPIDHATLIEATEVFDGRLVQSFGQMESPMFFTILDQQDHMRARNEPNLARSAGRVLPGVTLRVIDENGSDLPPGQPGEIVVSAPQTMNGYWNRPEDTAETLVDGWLHTGDIGYFDEDGYLHLVDRKKDMIVTGGSNVYAREVEEVLSALPGIREAAVIGLPHRIWGEAVTAVLVADGKKIDDDAVITACREKLAGYRVPKRVVWVEELPRNAYGKVLKRQLRERFATAS